MEEVKGVLLEDTDVLEQSKVVQQERVRSHDRQRNTQTNSSFLDEKSENEAERCKTKSLMRMHETFCFSRCKAAPATLFRAAALLFFLHERKAARRDREHLTDSERRERICQVIRDAR